MQTILRVLDVEIAKLEKKMSFLKTTRSFLEEEYGEVDKEEVCVENDNGVEGVAKVTQDALLSFKRNETFSVQDVYNEVKLTFPNKDERKVRMHISWLLGREVRKGRLKRQKRNCYFRPR